MVQGIERVIGLDLVPERLARARDRGVDVIDVDRTDDLCAAIEDRTSGRGPDSVIDAVGMEAHGDLIGKMAHQAVAFMPRAIAAPMSERAGVDRLAALRLAIQTVRRGGTISLVGVYGGMVDPIPMMLLFDKQVTLRMGQANVRRWVDDLMPFLDDEDRLGVDGFATHHMPLESAPDAYAKFQTKDDGVVKVIFQP
jgi:threonine dehydrogenase-like Zn-dependent dehydrogenase